MRKIKEFGVGIWKVLSKIGGNTGPSALGGRLCWLVVQGVRD